MTTFKSKFIIALLLSPILLGGFGFEIDTNSDVVEEIPTIVVDVPEPQVLEPEAAETVYEITQQDIPLQTTVFEIPNYPGIKKWESYKAFNHSSRQYQLQTIAVTNELGLRVVGNRYCVALGTHFGASIGQCFDLILENGTVIPCVLGDVKAPQHTDASNIFSNTTRNLCASEFIVDTQTLHSSAKHSGDTSSICAEWMSPVKAVILYSINLI